MYLSRARKSKLGEFKYFVKNQIARFRTRLVKFENCGPREIQHREEKIICLSILSNHSHTTVVAKQFVLF